MDTWLSVLRFLSQRNEPFCHLFTTWPWPRFLVKAKKGCKKLYAMPMVCTISWVKRYNISKGLHTAVYGITSPETRRIWPQQLTWELCLQTSSFFSNLFKHTNNCNVIEIAHVFLAGLPWHPQPAAGFSASKVHHGMEWIQSKCCCKYSLYFS